MPLQHDLIMHIQAGNLAEAQIIIEENHDIVNQEYKCQKSFLMAVFSCVADSEPLIQFIAFNLPKLNNLGYSHPGTKRTIFDEAIEYRSPQMVKLLIDHHKEKGFDIFEKDGKLQWEIVTKRIANTQTGIFRNEANKKDTSKECAKRDRFGEIANLLRDATILEAIHTDDPTLLRRLEAVDGQVLQSLSNGLAPREYAEELGKKNVVDYYYGEYREILAKQVDSLFSIGTSNLSFLATENELGKVTSEYKQAIDNEVTKHANDLHKNTQTIEERLAELAL